MKFLWTTLYVKNLETSIDFYQEYLNLKLVKQFKVGEMELAFLGEGETQVELIHDPTRILHHSKDISIGFLVDDLDEHYRKLIDAGVHICHDIIETPISKFYTEQDPNGVHVQFFKYL
jgi:lactoylglutathione lyase